MVATTQKKVYFFLIRTALGDKEVDPRTVLAGISPLWAQANAYQAIDPGRQLSVEDLGQTSSEFRLRMGTTRSRELPFIDDAGSKRGLNLKPSEGLYEPTHLTLFSGNIIAIESSYYGPRPQAIKRYLEEKFPYLCDRVDLVELIDPEAFRKLQRLDEIRLFKMRIERAVLGQIADLSPDLHTSFKAMARAGDAEELMLGYFPPKNQRSPTELKFLGRLLNWMSREENRRGVTELEVKGIDSSTGQITTFDLLEPVIVHSQHVVLIDDKHRVVDPDSMFDALRKGFTSRKSSLGEAADRARRELPELGRGHRGGG